MSENSKNYLTLKEAGSNEIIIKKSRFICSLQRTETVDQAQEFITQISKKYRDATHNTYAYTIGLSDDQVKASDNGEPSGTAGVPELKALQLMKLKNVTAVVTRYFGGIKLGAGGLIRAYSNAVTSAVEAIGVVRCVEQKEVKVKVAYPNYEILNHYLQEHDIFVDNTAYATDVEVTVYLDLDDLEKFKTDVINLLSGNAKFIDGQNRFNEIPVKNNNFHEQ